MQKLKRGSRPIEATLDLHGFSVEHAHARLNYFIQQCRRNKTRYVLIITGKGGRKNVGASGEPGILRRSVPQWLSAAPLKDSVVGISAAHHHMGGEGALYVALRTKEKK